MDVPGEGICGSERDDGSGPPASVDVLADAAAILSERTRTGFVLIAVAIVLSAASDFAFLPGQGATVHAVQLAQLALVLSLYAAARRLGKESARGLALLGIGIVSVGVAATGIATGDDTTAPLLLVALVIACATLLPWGAGPQATTVMLAGGALAWNIHAVSGSLSLASRYPTLVAVGLSFGASMYIAHRLQRHARLAAAMARRQAEADRALRRAHAQLEQRVEERTAELRRVNRELEIHIAERGRIEEEARRRQAELAHFARLSTVGQMAAEVAHELNQPLGAIANFAHGCAQRLRSGQVSGAELLPVVEQIAAQAMRAGGIIRQLTGFARKREARFEVRDLNRLVGDVCRFMDSEARRGRIKVRLDLAPDLPPVEFDRIQIEEVMVNLVRNALESMEAAGEAPRELSVATRMATPEMVEVTVCDTGTGFTREAAARAFEPFFTTKPYGLGVGLSISRSLIEAHGGRLWVGDGSDSARGAAVHLTLPLAPREGDLHRPPSASPA
jgi:signal transduction histidine kinase